MTSIPIGSEVTSRFGQSGVVVPRTSGMWPTFVEVHWTGTDFTTVEDPHKLILAAPPAQSFRVGRFAAKVSRPPSKPLTDDQRERQSRSIDTHAAMLARARQRGMVRA